MESTDAIRAIMKVEAITTGSDPLSMNRNPYIIK